MPDLGTQIATARQAGYSDADITAYLAKDPSMGPKVAQAKSAGYSDAEIADHLTSGAAPAKENVFQKAARIAGSEWNAASDAFKGDVQTAIQTHNPVDQAKPVLDAARAVFSPIKGIADATFGDQPAHLPASIAGVQVPQALQNVNSKGLTGGDIAQMVVPGAGEMKTAATTGQFAKDAGITARTADQTLASSKAAQPPVSIARNDLTVKAPQVSPQANALSVGAPAAAKPVSVVRGDPAATVEALRSAKSSAYDAVDQAGVQYTPDAFKGMVQSITKDAAYKNISLDRHPKASSMLSDLQGMAADGKSPTLTELDQVRQVVRRDVAASHDEAEAYFGKRIIDGIDNFVQGAKPADLASGNSGSAADLITGARAANAQYRKAEAVTDAVDAAKLRASSTGSGGNADNAIRQNLRRVLETTPNLTDDEKSALTSIVSGGMVQNALRFAGKASPATGGLNSLIGIGATTATHGALGVPLMATTGAKFAADAITNAKVNQLLSVIAAGGSRANIAAEAAWTARMAKAAQTSPQAASSALGRLRTAAQSNPLLVPVYQGAVKTFSGGPRASLPAAASPTSPEQGTPGSNN